MKINHQERGWGEIYPKYPFLKRGVCSQQNHCVMTFFNQNTKEVDTFACSCLCMLNHFLCFSRLLPPIISFHIDCTRTNLPIENCFIVSAAVMEGFHGKPFYSTSSDGCIEILDNSPSREL